MRKSHHGALLVLLVLGVLPLWGQEPGGQIESLLDSSTVAAVRVSKLPAEWEAWRGFVATFEGPFHASTSALVLAERLLQAGAEEIVLTVRIAPGRFPFLVVCRASSGLGREEVLALTQGLDVPQQADVHEGWIVVGESQAVETLRAPARLPAAPGWQAAFDSVGDCPVQIVVALTAEQRRAFGELQSLAASTPWLPLIAGAQQLESISMGIRANEPRELLITVQPVQGVSADELAGTLNELPGRLKDLLPPTGSPNLVGELLPLCVFDTEGGFARLRAQGDRLAAIDRVVSLFRERWLAQATTAAAELRIRQLMIGLHNFHDAQRAFPLPWIAAPDGKPLLSWRVAILPFVGETKLYEQFHLDEPWESPHNRTLIEKMPAIFHDPRSGLPREEGRSSFLQPVGNGALFELTEPVSLEQISNMDGTSRTIALFESDDEHAQVWTQPAPFLFDPQQPLLGLRTPDVLIVFADCTLKRLNQPDAASVLSAFLKQDGQVP